MQNVKMAVQGKTLTITIDLAAQQTPSKSGKSKVIASTQGNVSLPDHPEVKIGINCYTGA